MLTIYSRYCRLFVDDLEMRKKYFHAILNLHQLGNDVMPFWVDVAKIEKHYEMDCTLTTSLMKTIYIDPAMSQITQTCNEQLKLYFDYRQSINKCEKMEAGEFWFMQEQFSDIQKFKTPIFDQYFSAQSDDEVEYTQMDVELPPNSSSLVVRRDFGNPKKQKFAFCPTIIQHIFNSFPITYKLQKTCKHFFAFNQKVLCYSLVINNTDDDAGIRITANSMQLTSASINEHLNNDPNFLTNFIITSTLHIDNPLNRQCFSTILWRRCLFQTKYLKLKNQDLTLKEIQMLNECCKLVTVRLIDVNIFEIDNLVSVEAVVASFPNAKNLFLK